MVNRPDFFRQILLEVPIFTNYILTHRGINVNRFFSFFGIFIPFFYRGCSQAPAGGGRDLQKIFGIHIDFFISIV